MSVSSPENKELFGCIYLDDVYCATHETDPSYIEAYYDKGYEKYFYVARYSCNNLQELLLGSKEGLALALDDVRNSIISGYPEVTSNFDNMVKKIRKHKP
jgi:hypothetical protein